MHLSEIKSKIKDNRRKIIAVLCVVILVIFSNCIIDGKIICRFTTELSVDTVTDKDVDNIKGLYFLKNLNIYNCETSDSSFLENKKYLKKLFIKCDNIKDWSYLENCPKLEYFGADGNCVFNNLECFSGLENIKSICIGYDKNYNPVIKSLDGLQDISKTLNSLTLISIENEINLNLEKFSNLRWLDIKNSSLREIRVNSYLENLNINDNPDLRAIYLPVHYGTPENIYTDNSPYVNIIYESK